MLTTDALGIRGLREGDGFLFARVDRAAITIWKKPPSRNTIDVVWKRHTEDGEPPCGLAVLSLTPQSPNREDQKYLQSVARQREHSLKVVAMAQPGNGVAGFIRRLPARAFLSAMNAVGVGPRVQLFEHPEQALRWLEQSMIEVGEWDQPGRLPTAGAWLLARARGD